MKRWKLSRRDWIIALVVGSVIGAWAVMDDLGGEGEGGWPSPRPASPESHTREGGQAGGIPGAGSRGMPDASHGSSASRGGTGATAAGGGTTATEAGSVRGVTRLRPHTVTDRSGFGQPVEAMSVLVPEGWRFASQVTWKGEGGFCSADHAGVFWDATSPDGDVAVGYRPAIFVSNWPDTFQGLGLSPTGFCHLGMVASNQEFVERVLVPTVRPGNRIVEVEELTDIPAHLRQQAQARSQLDAVLGGRTTASGAAVATRTPDGRHDELILVYYLVTDLPSPSPVVPSQRMIQTLNPLVIRAPAGEAERAVGVAATILATVRVNPGWVRAIQEVDANISRIQAQGAADRSRILAESFREVGEIQMSGWRARTEADWRGAQSVADALAGLDRRVDAHTGQEVRLEAGGARYFANAAGEYLIVHAPDIDPRWLYPSEDWREMRSAGGSR